MPRLRAIAERWRRGARPDRRLRSAVARAIAVMDWTIERLVDEADLDGLLDVEAASFNNPWTRQMYLTELRYESIARIYLLRTATEGVAGFCSFWLVFDEVHINNLAVRPECRGRGYGTALLLHILREARQQGARRATLEVRRSNVVALRLYERLGFDVAGTRREYYTNPVEDALILWKKELDPAAGPSGRDA